MSSKTYLYQVNYPSYEKELCLLEQRMLFGQMEEKKMFFSSVFICPSISPYIKQRLEIIHTGDTFEALVNKVGDNVIRAEQFRVDFVSFTFEEIHLVDRRRICETVGLKILGRPNFKKPEIVYGVTNYDNQWYFGVLEINNNLWKAHINKPNSYSSSLGINLAKVLANIASEGDVHKRLIDPCCGVGTVLLEAAFAGYQIIGAEIKHKVAKNARRNLQHYGYEVDVMRVDINDIEERYDVSIIDLPYGNFSPVTEDQMLEIIRSGLRIAKRMVMVSSVDLRDVLSAEGIAIMDQCVVSKKETKSFDRYVWVCLNRLIG